MEKKSYINNLTVGDVIKFGLYPQNGDAATPVEWNIIDMVEGKALLLSKYALITTGYCNSKPSHYELEWENSLARKICRQFYDECFSEKERKYICEKTIIQNGFGADCRDYVFLLSENEVLQYLPTEKSRKCEPSANALAAGARLGWTEDTKKMTSWWILPECESGGGSWPGYHGEIYPKAVFQTGYIQFHSRNVFHEDFTIRPAVIIDLSGPNGILKLLWKEQHHLKRINQTLQHHRKRQFR